MEIDFEILREYNSRLKEVFRQTGKLTDVDVDYCLLLTFHEHGIKMSIEEPNQEPMPSPS